MLNAGVYLTTPLLSTPYDAWVASWERTLATNLVGPACLAYHAARQMVAQPPRDGGDSGAQSNDGGGGGGGGGGGAMVFVGSRGGSRGEPEAFAYGASKLGLNNLVGSLAQARATAPPPSPPPRDAPLSRLVL